MEDSKNLEQTVGRIAEKYAKLVENRIDSDQVMTGTELSEFNEEIRALGHLIATLERFSRMEDLSDCDPYS